MLGCAWHSCLCADGDNQVSRQLVLPSFRNAESEIKNNEFMKKVFIDLWLIMMSLTCQPVTTLSQRCHIGYICHENNEKKYLVLGMGISHTQEGCPKTDI